MVVRTECKGRKVTGIYIGARNVRRNFPREVLVIDFELGHLHIGCSLGPGFWRDQPRICDPRLCDWLEFKLYRERRHVTPLPLVLVHASKNTYRLRPMILPAISLSGIGESNAAGALRHHHTKSLSISRKMHHLPVLATH